MLEAIGKELQIVRIRKDLDVKTVAKRLDCHVETLKRWEKNPKGLSIEKLEELLDFYNEDKVSFFANISANMHK